MTQQRIEMLRSILLDFLVKDDPFPAMHLVHYCLDQGITQERLALFIERRLHVPEWSAYMLLSQLTDKIYVH